MSTTLPASASWFDFHSGHLVAKERLLDVSQTDYHIVMTPKTLQHIPVFVRSGSFVPMSPVVQSTESYRDSAVVIHYYIDAQQASLTSEFVWFEDDGSTFDAENKGVSKKLLCKSVKSAALCTLEFKADFGAQLQKKSFQFAVQVHTNKAPKSVKVGGKRVKFTFEEEKQVLQIANLMQLNNEQNAALIEIKW
jgi:hypothetical protein